MGHEFAAEVLTAVPIVHTAHTRRNQAPLLPLYAWVGDVSMEGGSRCVEVCGKVAQALSAGSSFYHAAWG